MTDQHINLQREAVFEVSVTRYRTVPRRPAAQEKEWRELLGWNDAHA